MSLWNSLVRYHLTVSQYRGDLGALDAGDPDTPELTSAILNAIGTFDLEI
jgi:hypothetical protein